MAGSLSSFAAGFPYFLAHTGTAIAMLIIATTIYVLVSPIKEIALIRTGNAAAGLALGAVILGLCLPIAASLTSALSMFDILIWGVVALLVQILAFRAVDILLSGLSARIEEAQMGAAILLAALKISLAILLAAGLWDPQLAR